MNKLYSFIAVIILALTFSTSFAGIPPTFDMIVKNIQCIPGISSDSIVQFELYLQQTNFGQPGVDEFEYCCGQFTWECSRDIQNGNLVFGINTAPGANELPVSLRPPAYQVDSISAPTGKLYLKAAGNIPYNFENFFISPTFPGTKILTFRLRTSANSWPLAFFNLRFKLGSPPNTFVAYFLPYGTQDSDENPYQTAVALMDTGSNNYAIENNSGFFICGPYPVEIMSFTSNVSKNNVTLNWTTATESNNQGFDIERSTAGSDEWIKAGFIPGNGTISVPKDYSFSDKPNSGHYMYRLKQIDYNGSVNFHNLNGEVVVGLPTAYAVSQNYPNPFNPSTKIDFELPYDSKISIILYDISGREIAKIVNEQIAAGYHNVQFNGSNISSGMYFYRINADGNGQNFISTKKMVLIR
jgi:hypothetical protein